MRLKSLGILAVFFVTISAHALEFKKGEHYVEIKGTSTKNKQITEYFSFYCPACFKQEPFMNDLKASMPNGAVFTKNHVDGMPGRNPQIEQLLTKALVTAELLKVEDKIIPAIFNHIHISRANFGSQNEVKSLFTKNGVDGASFDKTFSSFGVNAYAKKMQRNTSNLRQQGFSAVPTLIVNGKYKPLTNKIKSMQEYRELVLFLLNKASN